MKSLNLKIYNTYIKISSDSDFAFENLKKDFMFYLCEGEINASRKIEMIIHKGAPPYNKVPSVEAFLYGRGFIAYRNKGVHYVDYADKALMIYDFRKEKAEFYSEDENLLYEKSRLTILSRIGELLDKQGMHRLHAVGFAKGKNATLCLLPMEAGKTTLAMHILKKNIDIKLIAEDVCFVDNRVYVYPFILRIGLRDIDLSSEIPKQYITSVNRTYYGEKHLIDVDYFRDRVAEKSRVRNILVGRRVFQDKTEIKKFSKSKCFIPFIQSGVFGLGLPQIVELFLQGGLVDTLNKIKILFSRTILFSIIILRTDTYELRIGRDRESSADELAKFIKNT